MRAACAQMRRRRSSAAAAAPGCRSTAPELPKPLVEIGGQADRLARDPHLRRPGLRRFAAADGLPRRADRARSRARRAGRPASRSSASTPGSTRRPAGASTRVRERLGERPFLATYADGVADIDLAALLAPTAATGALATMTVVRPRAAVRRRRARRRRRASRASTRSRAPSTGSTAASSASSRPRSTTCAPDSRARARAARAAGRRRRAAAYRHEGFWACMDTYKDAVALNDLWADGERRGAAVGAARH